MWAPPDVGRDGKICLMPAGSRKRPGYKLLTLGGVLALALGGVVAVTTADAATSPTLVAAAGYSVLGGAAVTCIGPTTTTGAVGVSPGSSITVVPPCSFGGGTHINDSGLGGAIAAQADATAAFTTLTNEPCTVLFTVPVNLASLSPLGPGVYCDASSFSLTGTLTLTTGPGVWIFKTVSTLITASGSSVTGGDPCNIWWRVGSNATLGSTTSFEGTIIAQGASTNALVTGATLNGRVLALTLGTVTLDNNYIHGPTCETTGGGTPPTTAPGGTPPTTAPGSTTTTAPGSTTTTVPGRTTTRTPVVVARFTG